MNNRTIPTVTAALLAVAPIAVQAYVGPGAGISLLGSLWGLIVGVVVALAMILFWPIRIMLRKRKAAKAAEAEAGSEESAAVAETAPDDSAPQQ